MPSFRQTKHGESWYCTRQNSDYSRSVALLSALQVMDSEVVLPIIYIDDNRSIGYHVFIKMKGKEIVMDSRLLLVDDDRLLREVIGEYLTAKGYTVDLAEGAEEAIEIFAPGKYSLALIDLVMPKVNGLQLMESILEVDSDIFCLIMTGYPTIDSAYKAMIDGVSDYVIKPFQLSELLEIIKKYT